MPEPSAACGVRQEREQLFCGCLDAPGNRQESVCHRSCPYRWVRHCRAHARTAQAARRSRFTAVRAGDAIEHHRSRGRGVAPGHRRRRPGRQACRMYVTGPVDRSGQSQVCTESDSIDPGVDIAEHLPRGGRQPGAASDYRPDLADRDRRQRDRRRLDDPDRHRPAGSRVSAGPRRCGSSRSCSSARPAPGRPGSAREPGLARRNALLMRTRELPGHHAGAGRLGGCWRYPALSPAGELYPRWPARSSGSSAATVPGTRCSQCALASGTRA